MDNVTLIWFVGSLVFVGGGICGVTLYYIFSDSSSRSERLSAQLNELQVEYMEYKEKVADHFTSSASLMNKMTDTYRDIHEHMSGSAAFLCQDIGARNKLGESLLSSNTLLTNKVANRGGERPKPLEQPKDYAPKRKSEEPGVLSEHFEINAGQKIENE